VSNFNKYWTARGNSKKAEVFTPSFLVREMLDKIPAEIWRSSETIFLDPCFGSGTFIKCIIEKLREYGHSDENISKRIWGVEINRKWYNRVKHFRIGEYNIRNIYCVDALNTNILDGMKFDVVCGNPPYQGKKLGGGAGSGNAIWHKFVVNAFNALKENGYLCLIHPIDWRTNLSQKKIESARKILMTNQIEYLKLASAPFPGIGAYVDWYILKKREKKENTLIDFLDCQKNVFLDNKLFPLYSYNSDTVNSIKSKVLMDATNNLNMRKPFHGLTILDRSKPKGKYKFAHGTGYTKNEWKYYDYPHIHQYHKKVIMSSVRIPRAIYDDGNIGIGDHVHYILVNNKEEGEFLTSVINSKLGIFLQKIFVTTFWDGESSHWNNPYPISKLKIDNRKFESDIEIYDYFGLSKEEREYIDKELRTK